ncbi:MAG: hypothetical protein KDJ26_00420 [Alphaproteobacteria bacterium]|jgi:hypothetical protein|nr:hypothetical protein [Alphaproteobacteria bacterium]MCB1550441.1 hypothetical protein [Alphaproteobacteria bacterium]MCB9985532.1 hypothetical protein [Micavibrio sp.]HPQ50713.1 hypothetical protein [Alphaproteobacteria bacterium]
MTFETPLWILLGFAASLFNTAIPLIQEKIKADGFALAVWVKIAVVIFSFPVVLYMGFPTDIGFYLMTAISAAIWCINDIIYFRTIPVVGAGVVSRILPASVILSFVVWFGFDPQLLNDYLERPWQATALCLIVLLSVTFSIMMKSCPITWKGIRMIWLVVIAAAIGPLIDKLSLGYAPAANAPFAFMFSQGLIMLVFWATFSLIKKPVSRAVFFSPASLKAGLSIGAVATVKMALKFQALIYCDHPALLSVILFTDALWIIFYYRLTGREDHSKIWAGIGLVACAAALVLVKSL